MAKKKSKPELAIAELLPTQPPEVAVEPLRGPVRRQGNCSVCGEPAAPFSDEQLCWVCRRLKISAWREVETQAGLQE